MGQATEFNLEKALEDFISTVNSGNLLSETDKDELRDHLTLEFSSLTELGLTEEEAFLISLKRFGYAELVQAEYQKAKPGKRIFQLLVFSIVAIFSIKTVLNIMTISSLSVAVIVQKLSLIDFGLYIKWGDVGVQVLTLFMAILIGFIVLQRADLSRIKNLWPIPVAFISSELLRVFMFYYSIPVIDVSSIGSIQLHYSLIVAGMATLGVLASSWMMYKHQNLSMSFL